MTKSHLIDGKQMYNIRHVSKCTGYSSDYVTRLARSGKIRATQISRNWFVDMDSVKSYVAMAELEQKLRQQQLSEERKRQLQLNEILSLQSRRQPTLSNTHTKKNLSLGGLVLATVALMMYGVIVSTYLPFRNPNTQVASVGQISRIEDGSVENFAIAADTSDSEDQVQLNFSHESSKLSTLSEKSKGVLLLPDVEIASASDAEKFFSDDVTVMTNDVTGEKFVARIDNNGAVIEKIPFVVVPVKNQTP